MTPTPIEIATARGTMPVYLSAPSATGPRPAVVLYMDASGVREDLHTAAKRLSDAGYVAVLPDLYYWLDAADRPDPARIAAGDQEERAKMMTAAQSLEDDGVVQDTHALLERLAGDKSIDSSQWGCVGFCMGGRFGMRAAEGFGEQLRAASLLHPTHLVTDEPDSPHLGVASVRGELYLGFGEADAITPLSTIPPLREQLEQHGVAHTIEVLSGAEHGYTMPHHAGYNRAAAERAWTETVALLARTMPLAG